MISETLAKTFSNDDCTEGCNGTGWVTEDLVEGDVRERYCVCSINNMPDAKESHDAEQNQD